MKVALTQGLFDKIYEHYKLTEERHKRKLIPYKVYKKVRDIYYNALYEFYDLER